MTCTMWDWRTLGVVMLLQGGCSSSSGMPEQLSHAVVNKIRTSCTGVWCTGNLRSHSIEVGGVGANG